MIGVLLRKDPAIRTLPPLVACAVLLGALSVLAVSKLVESDREVFGPLTATLALAPLIQVLFVSWVTAIGGWAGVRQRAGEMQLVLPVPIRTWLGLRLTGLLLVGWLPLGITCATVFFAVDAPEARRVMLTSGAASALSWAAWVALCFAWRPERPRLDSLPAFLGITGIGLALAWASLLYPKVGAPLSLLVLLVAAVLVWRRIPSVMEVQHTLTDAEQARSSRAQGGPARNPDQSLRAWIARRTWLLGRNVALLLAMALAAYATTRDKHSVSSNLVIALFFSGLFVAHSTRVLRDLTHLPITRDRLALRVFLPPLIVLLLGAVGGAVERGFSGEVGWYDEVDLVRRRAQVEDGGRKSQRVKVPGALLRPKLGSGPIVVTAPWGERATLHPEPLVQGLPLYFANPYDITPESSIDFVAWQLSRAVRDAYGVEAEPAALRDAHLSVLRGEVIGPYFGMHFLEEHPQITDVTRPGALGWWIAVIVLGWLVMAWGATLTNVPAGDRAGWWRRRKQRFLLFGGAIAAFLLVTFGPFQWEIRLPQVRDSLAAAMVRVLGGSEWALPVLSVAVAALGYLWLARRFERLEVPPPLKRTWYQAPE